MRFRFPFNWHNKFGTIPSEFREAMSYEEQILWLCKANEDLQEQFDSFKVSIDDLTLRVRNVETSLNNKQDKLIAGENIFMFNNEILAELNLDLSNEIHSGSYIDLSGDVGSYVEATPIEAPNTAYYVINVKPNDYFLMRGTFTLAKTTLDDEITLKYEEPIASDTFSFFKASTEGKVYISWHDTDKTAPYFAQNVSAEYVIKNFENIPEWVAQEQPTFVDTITPSSTNNEIPSAEAVYQLFQSGGSETDFKVDYTSQIVDGFYIDLLGGESSITIGTEINIEPIVSANAKYFIKQVIAGEKFNIVGAGSYALLNNSDEIVEGEDFDSQNESEGVKVIEVATDTKLVVNLTTAFPTDSSIKEVLTNSYFKNEVDESPIKTIHYDIILKESSSQIEGYNSGFYYLKGHYIKVFDGTDYNEIPDSRNAIVYVNKLNDTISIATPPYVGTNKMLSYDSVENQWSISSGELVDSIDQYAGDNEIPSALAVKTYVDNTLNGVANTLQRINTGSGV